jgi:hypothetical protein
MWPPDWRFAPDFNYTDEVFDVILYSEFSVADDPGLIWCNLLITI